MVRCCLARRVWAIRLVAIGFAKRRIALAQRAINFICGNVKKAEGVFDRFRQLPIVRTNSFQHAEGADDIGLNKIFGPVDAAVDVGFGGKIDDGARLMFHQQATHQIEIADAAMHENMPRIAFERGEIIAVARICQGIQIDYRLGRGCQPIKDKVTANKTGAAGDHDRHRFISSRKLPRQSNRDCRTRFVDKFRCVSDEPGAAASSSCGRGQSSPAFHRFPA